MIPYQGSKQAIVKTLVNVMHDTTPCKSDFCDLFGGGGAVANYVNNFKKNNLFEDFEFKNVYYNELSTVFYAFKWLQENDLNSILPPSEWVSRERFNEAKLYNFNIKDDYLRAKNALIKCCFSFATNQNGYLYAKEIEDFKYAVHLFNFAEYSNEVVSEIALKIENNTFFFNEIPHKAIVNRDKIADFMLKKVKGNRRFFLNKCLKIEGVNLQKGNEKKAINRLESTARNERIQQILTKKQEKDAVRRLAGTEHIERIDVLKQENNTDKLIKCSQKDAFEILKNPKNYVENPENTIFYADPPYIDTKGYGDDFDFETFKALCVEFKHTLYISEYTNYFPFKTLKSIEKRQLACKEVRSNVVNELLIWNHIN